MTQLHQQQKKTKILLVSTQTSKCRLARFGLETRFYARCYLSDVAALLNVATAEKGEAAAAKAANTEAAKRHKDRGS